MTQPILAQYTVRSKQEYIFRSDRMQEIVGASAIISQSCDLLFSCAEQLGVKTERGGGPFNMEETLRKFSDARWIWPTCSSLAAAIPCSSEAGRFAGR